MAAKLELDWLPEHEDWKTAIAAVEKTEAPDWQHLVQLANYRLDFRMTERLDGTIRRKFKEPPAGLRTKPVRLAILGSSTVGHLAAGIRAGALRRGIWVEIYQSAYGQYIQELLDTGSALHRFKPTVVLLAFDAYHIASGAGLTTDVRNGAAVDDALNKITGVWELARGLNCPVIQQAILPILPSLMGNNEQRFPGSPNWVIDRLNIAMREAADVAGVHILAVDKRAAQDGTRDWHNVVLWHRGKQEVSPLAVPIYGDLVARLFAAIQGTSFKCLALDLDNTLWGGVIGDDGLDGIQLGQGAALGEAFVAFQVYARQLRQRGVILAVCSKNDEAVAYTPFDEHPEMILKREDISSFVANWDDKATNIRRIAEELNIGLDAIVFVDDNPFERNLVRRELPMVAVPEVPEDAALIPHCLADAGYFESLGITSEDLERTEQYQANRSRDALKSQVTDLASYLSSLDMVLSWRPFDTVGMPRTVQLINKSNQFNLTTRRYTDQTVRAVIDDPRAFGLQLRLIDRFGDNGIIAIVIGRMSGESDVMVDTWLMSCRVLGRQVEEATLNLLAEHARRLGARRLIGEYIATAKNGMVKDHYTKLGFTPLDTGDERACYVLDLPTYVSYDTIMRVEQEVMEPAE